LIKKNFIFSFYNFFYLSVKSDTKWLSWLAYQFHIIASKKQMDDSMDLETFKTSFYFKVVCIFKQKEKYVCFFLTLFKA
jgi:hypothetical protein